MCLELCLLLTMITVKCGKSNKHFQQDADRCQYCYSSFNNAAFQNPTVVANSTTTKSITGTADIQHMNYMHKQEYLSSFSFAGVTLQNRAFSSTDLVTVKIIGREGHTRFSPSVVIFLM